MRTLRSIVIAMSFTRCACVLFGQHFPFGQEAIDYLYGPQGTFHDLQNVIYEYNYYEQYATNDHPYDKSALIGMSNGTTLTTCRDANGHLLLDFDHDYELDVSSAGGLSMSTMDTARNACIVAILLLISGSMIII